MMLDLLFEYSLYWFAYPVCIGVVAYLGEFGEKQTKKTIRIAVSVGLMVVSCHILYLALIRPTCQGSTTLGNLIVMICLSIGTIAGLTLYWGSRVSRVKMFKTVRRPLALVVAAFLAGACFTYMNVVPYYCPAGGHVEVRTRSVESSN